MHFSVPGCPLSDCSLDWSPNNEIAVCTNMKTYVFALSLVDNHHSNLMKYEITFETKTNNYNHLLWDLRNHTVDVIVSASFSPLYSLLSPKTYLFCITAHGRAMLYSLMKTYTSTSWEIVTLTYYRFILYLKNLHILHLHGHR
jgi:hypothetical protein